MSFYSTRSSNIASELGGESCKRCQSPNKRIFDVFCCRAAAKRIVINFLSGKHFRSTLLLCHTRLHRKKERGISAGFTFSTCMITKQQEWILGLSEPFHLISLACSTFFFPLYKRHLLCAAFCLEPRASFVKKHLDPPTPTLEPSCCLNSNLFLTSETCFSAGRNNL